MWTLVTCGKTKCLHRHISSCNVYRFSNHMAQDRSEWRNRYHVADPNRVGTRLWWWWCPCANYLHKLMKFQLPFKLFTCSAVFSTPRISPSFDPASSQNRWRDLFWLCFSRISRTNADPLRAIIAISDVASFNGIIGSACFVKTTLPSRNGGFVSVIQHKVKQNVMAGLVMWPQKNFDQ